MPHSASLPAPGQHLYERANIGRLLTQQCERICPIMTRPQPFLAAEDGAIPSLADKSNFNSVLPANMALQKAKQRGRSVLTTNIRRGNVTPATMACLTLTMSPWKECNDEGTGHAISSLPFVHMLMTQ